MLFPLLDLVYNEIMDFQQHRRQQEQEEPMQEM